MSSGPTSDHRATATLSDRSRTVARAGRMLLESGASAHAVKEFMKGLAHHLRIDRQETAITLNSLITTSYKGHEFRTEVLEVPGVGVNATITHETRTYLTKLPPTADSVQVNKDLDRIQNTPPPYSRAVTAIAAGAACAGFDFLGGGRWVELAVVFISALLGFLVQSKLLSRNYNKFGAWMVTSGFTATLYMALSLAVEVAFQIPPGHHAGIIAATLFLIPGVPMVTAVAEIVSQEYSMGATRAIFAATLIAAAGSALWLLLQFVEWRVVGGLTYELPAPALIPLQALATFVASTGFAIIFKTPLRTAFYAGGIAAFANVLRLHFLVDEFGPTLAAGAAALIMGLLAALVTHFTHQEQSMIAAPALVVLIPGGAIYRTLTTLGTADLLEAGKSLVSVSFTIGLIGVGYAMSLLVTNRSWRRG